MGRQVILLSGLICFYVTRCYPSRLCDNGKTNLATDVPGPQEFVCDELWPQSQTNIPDIDTKHAIEDTDYICMDTPIKYNDRVPTHGPYRPVAAESGDYLYCPPQRWLNNLKNGALVFLYHPCVSVEAHSRLAALAHLCLPHYILTPHPELSQHRPLAVVSWGRSLEMSRITLGVCDWLLSISSDISQASTSQRAKYNLFLTQPAPVDKPVNNSHKMSRVERLKSLSHCCMEALSNNEAQSTRRKTRKVRAVLKPSMKEVELKENVKPDNVKSAQSEKLNHTNRLPQNKTRETASFSMLNVTESLSLAKDSEEPRDGAKDWTRTNEKQTLQNETNERPKSQTDRKSQKKTRFKTDTKAQRSGSECGELGQCGVQKSISGERIPIPRTDEAVWAAGALGFLLVLLTLSVLHTRLYRHCRSSTSLYWHDNQQDYDNVGDIIRRRLRKFGRRKRRSSHSRRQDRPLLSNSSNDENSD